MSGFMRYKKSDHMRCGASNLQEYLSVTLAVLFCAVLIMLPGFAHAGGVASQVGGNICAIAYMFSGNAGRGIATIGVSVLGIGALIGKVTWTQALIVGVGVAVLFGAYELAANLGAGFDCPPLS